MEVSSLHASVRGFDCFSQVYKPNTNITIMEMPKKPLRNIPQHQPWPPLRCPRCNSTNTKFCYYNNYSKSQPRFLCKSCRRHWTEGGTLRDVPVGGGRKTKRTKNTGTSQTATNTSMTNNNSTISSNSSLVQQLLSGNPNSSLFPEMLCQVLLRMPQQPFPLPVSAQTASDNFGLASSLIGSRHSTGTNLGSYSSDLNTPNFSISGYAETGINGFSMAAPVQIGVESWGAWDDEISGLVNVEGNPPPSCEGC